MRDETLLNELLQADTELEALALLDTRDLLDPKTFSSLISAGEEGSYKKGVRFVQGQFNMGGTGVLPFCSEKRKLQLIVSRVPPDVAKGNEHEWAFTLFCFFEEEAAWCYLVGND